MEFRSKKYLKRSSTSVTDIETLSSSEQKNQFNQSQIKSPNISTDLSLITEAKSSTKSSLKSNKRSNKRFQELFPSLANSENVIKTFSCAYVKSLNLFHGVMFLTPNYICFYSKILTSENILQIKLNQISSIKKTMHALIFPTAILIEVLDSSYTFTSFRSRSNTLDHLVKMLNNHKEIPLSQFDMTSESNQSDQNITNLNGITENTRNLTNLSANCNEILFDINDEEEKINEDDSNDQDAIDELILNENTNENILSSFSNQKNKSANLLSNKPKNKSLFKKTKEVSKRSNKRFRQLFPSLESSEHVVKTFSCAYVKSLNLFHGVMFLTTNYICFYSKILTSENILQIRLNEITCIKKTMHALIFPTAIRVETQNFVYTFTSFRSRTNTLNHLRKILNNHKEIPISQFDESTECSQNDQNSTNFNITSENFRNLTETSTDSSQIHLDTKEEGKCNVNRIDNYKLTNEISTDKRTNQIKHENLYKNYKSKNCFNINYNHSNSLIYEFDYSNISKNQVTVSLRHKKTLIQKVKILVGLLIPAFFNISRIDSLLPICFLMCMLLLLNAFVLLNKVNEVDVLFTDLLLISKSIIN